MVSGNGAAHVYLRPGHVRENRWTISDIERGHVEGIPHWTVSHLADLDGVAMIAGIDDDDDVVLVSSQGRARLRTLENGAIAYIPTTADVLQTGGKAAVHSPAAWLERTYDGPFPDAPMQLTQIFRAARSGDLVVAAGPRADLREEWEIPEHHSGHGSIVTEHMQCLMALNRPATEPMRTVDLFPLILEHLGHAIPQNIDGRLHQGDLHVASSSTP